MMEVSEQYRAPVPEGWGPFDPSDPFDIMSDHFRKSVAGLVLDADKITVYREMSAQQQMECFAAGALTGIIGVLFSGITPEGREYIMEYVRDALPNARVYAESVLDGPTPCK